MTRRIPLSCLLLTLLGACSAGPTDAELAQRAAESHPAWQSYNEDIKAQMGARPSAEWSGTLSHVTCEPESFRATFHVTGAWASRDAAMPVLMREPTGHVFQNRESTREGSAVTYVFERAASVKSENPAWLEFRFPHGEQRVAFNGQGAWHADER